MAFSRDISYTISITPVNVDEALDMYSYYDNNLLTGDFNAENASPLLEKFSLLT